MNPPAQEPAVKAAVSVIAAPAVPVIRYGCQFGFVRHLRNLALYLFMSVEMLRIKPVHVLTMPCSKDLIDLGMETPPQEVHLARLTSVDGLKCRTLSGSKLAAGCESTSRAAFDGHGEGYAKERCSL